MSELRHHNRTPLRRGFVLSHTPFLRPDARRPAACGCSLARYPRGTPCTRRKWLNNNNLRAGCRGAAPPTSPAPRCLLPSSYRPWTGTGSAAPYRARSGLRAAANATVLSGPGEVGAATLLEFPAHRPTRLALGLWGKFGPDNPRAEHTTTPHGEPNGLRRSMSNRRECGGVRGT